MRTFIKIVEMVFLGVKETTCGTMTVILIIYSYLSTAKCACIHACCCVYLNKHETVIINIIIITTIHNYNNNDNNNNNVFKRLYGSPFIRCSCE